MTVSEQQYDKERRALGDLLAVIHRDGGQHLEAHGPQESGAVAQEIVCALRVNLDEERERKEAVEFGANELVVILGRREAALAATRKALAATRKDVEDLRIIREAWTRYCEESDPTAWEDAVDCALNPAPESPGGAKGKR